jgi:hypothetical protein
MEQNQERSGVRRSMGWLRDYPDNRDYTPETKSVSRRLSCLNQKDSPHAMLAKARVAEPAEAKLPASIDLREWCSPVEDQGKLRVQP